jgi:CubicO group peptidase (beta-lactamase class C family)
MGLLGHLLARRLGGSYEALLVERVLEPLDLRDTRIRLGADQQRRLAPPYGPDLEPSANWDLAALAGAGGLRSSARDLLAFARINLAQREGSLGRALARAREQRRTIGNGLGIGLGWHVAADHQTRWHDGGTGGYHSWLAVVPELELGVVVLANTATDRVSQLGEQATRAAAGMPVAPARLPKEVAVDPERLERYVGYYQLTPEFGLEVSLEDGQLMVQATGQERFPVYPSAPFEFFYKVVDAQLSFVAGDSGDIERVVLHQNGNDIEGVRTR